MRRYAVIAVLSATAVAALMSRLNLGTDGRAWAGPSPAVSTGGGRAHARAASDVRRLLAAPRFEVNRGQFDERVD